MFHLIFKVIVFVWIQNCIHLNALIVTNSKVLREEYVNIEAIDGDKNEHGRHRRASHLFPPNIQFDITTLDTRLRLNLTRNSLNLDIPVYTHLGETIVRQNGQFEKQMAFYNDVKHMASIGVQFDDRSEDMSCRYTLNGHLSINGRHHIISPRSADHGVRRQHILSEVEDDYNFGTDYLEPPGPTLNASQFSSSISGSLLSNTHYKVELLAVCDYAVYQYWYGRQNTGNSAQKSQNAINNMKEHYAHVINAMNVIYGSISGVTWDIEILFAGIYVATSSTLSPWSENYKQTISGFPRKLVHGETALNSFVSWLTVQTGLPKYDHAMAFTGYDLHADGSSGLLGMAWVSRLCYTEVSNLLANSIQEDHLQARLGHVAAHELGHNLGALHDGQNNENSCPESDKYIMAPSIAATTSDKAINRYLFSTCSVEYFKTFINLLDVNSKNCMTSLTATDTTIELGPYSNTYNGRVYSVDEQCQQNFDSESSSLCRYHHYQDPTTVCRYIYCVIPEYPDYCSLKLPWDGTSCGDGKWCVAGQCVSDSRAKSVNTYCVLGDDPICSTVITRSGMCYDDDYRVKYCCDLCESYNTGISGCEYGDRNSDCDRSSCDTYSSYTRDTLCCYTCGIYYTTTTVTSSSSTSSNSTAIIAVVVVLVFVIGLAIAGFVIYKQKKKAKTSVAPLSTRML